MRRCNIYPDQGVTVTTNPVVLALGIYPGHKVDVGTVAAISAETLRGHTTIDAEGLVVAPGFIETDMTDGLPQPIKDQALAATPLRRLGSAHEVAAAVAAHSLTGKGPNIISRIGQNPPVLPRLLKTKGRFLYR